MLLSSEIVLCCDTSSAIVNRFLFPFVAHRPNVFHGVGALPNLRAQTPQAIERRGGSAPKDEFVVPNFHVQAVTRLDAQAPASIAWQGDLVLAADLDARHGGMVPSEIRLH